LSRIVISTLQSFKAPGSSRRLFTDALLNPVDQTDPSFLSLVAEVCAVTAQSFPQAARVILVGLDLAF